MLDYENHFRLQSLQREKGLGNWRNGKGRYEFPYIKNRAIITEISPQLHLALFLVVITSSPPRSPCMTHVHMCKEYRENKDMTCTISKGISIYMEGRVCLVTGGGSGVGAATATLMAKRGARYNMGFLYLFKIQDQNFPFMPGSWWGTSTRK